MRCGQCNYEAVVSTTTTVEEWDGDELIVIRDVPVEKCPRCGEMYFSPAVLRELERIVEQRHVSTEHSSQPISILRVPLFAFPLKTPA